MREPGMVKKEGQRERERERERERVRVRYIDNEKRRHVL
jgi:hypothetical protein